MLNIIVRPPSIGRKFGDFIHYFGKFIVSKVELAFTYFYLLGRATNKNFQLMLSEWLFGSIENSSASGIS